MTQNKDLKKQLDKFRLKNINESENAVTEANRILKKDLFTQKKILENLVQYNKSHELLDEEDLDSSFIFKLSEIKHICIINRLKFLDSKLYKSEIPYEAILKIKYLNQSNFKNIKFFKIMALPNSFLKESNNESLLFAKTNYDNYFLIHKWGNALKSNRKFKFWHLRNFENLLVSLFMITLVITLILPTEFITLDHKVNYWNGYRAAAFFHLLIFNTGVTAYITFTFSKNFSSSIWNKESDFN